MNLFIYFLFRDITLTIHLTKEPLRWGKDYLLKFEDGSVIDKEPEVSQMTETGLGIFFSFTVKKNV